MSNRIYIKGNTFSNIHSNKPGGSIYLATSVKVSIYQCYFNDCSSTGLINSTTRPQSTCSGGAIFVDVKEINLNTCVFMKCVGVGFGSAVYLCIPNNDNSDKFTNIYSLCDIECGNAISTYHSVYSFEQGKVDLKNFNSSSSISKNQFGVIHIGYHPKESICNYISVIFDKNDKDHIFLCVWQLINVSYRMFLYKIVKDPLGL